AHRFEDSIIAAMVVELDLQRAVVEEFGRSGTSDLVHVVVSLPLEGDVIVTIGEVEARLERAEDYLPMPVGTDDQHGRSAEVEMAPLPEVGRDDPPAADQLAIHRRAHGGAPARSFGRRTRS